MEDPVILLPAGIIYDRKQICKSLLHHPNLDPSSGVRYDGKLQYCDNAVVRQLLMETYGDKAYRKYDDSGFQPRYQEAWNTGKFLGRVTARNNSVEAYERVGRLLWGARCSKQINLKAALELVEMFPEDAVMVVLKAMFLDPKITVTTVESCVKDLGLARNAWDRALGIGLREQAITGNAWAQFAEGRRQFHHETNSVAAVEWTRKAAAQVLLLLSGPSVRCTIKVLEWPRAPVLLLSGGARLLCKDLRLLKPILGCDTKLVWEWRRTTVLLPSGTVRPRSRVLRIVKFGSEYCITRERVWNRATLLQWIGTRRRPSKAILWLNIISGVYTKEEALEWPRAKVLLSSGSARLPFKDMMMRWTAFNDHWLAARSRVDDLRSSLPIDTICTLVILCC
jgi:hypothetical protein